jgi:hypothetical protein
MKKKHIVIALCLCIAAVSITYFFKTSHRSPNQVRPEPLTLRERAKISKQYIAEAKPKAPREFESIESMGSASTTVILGTVESQNATLTQGDRFIVTDFQVRPTRVMKGFLTLDRSITIRVGGGRVQFDDGTSAEIVTPEVTAPQVGKKYVFFLAARPSFRFGLVGGETGIMEMNDNETLRTESHLPLTKNQSVNRTTFLTDVSRLVKQG